MPSKIFVIEFESADREVLTAAGLFSDPQNISRMLVLTRRRTSLSMGVSPRMLNMPEGGNMNMYIMALNANSLIRYQCSKQDTDWVSLDPLRGRGSIFRKEIAHTS